MTKINLREDEIWQYYSEHRNQLKTVMHKIADNMFFGIEIYLSDADGQPEVSVLTDGQLTYSDVATDEDDCLDMVKSIYNMFLYAQDIESAAKEADIRELKNSETDEIADEIDIREDQLDGAVLDFITAAVDGFVDEDDPEFGKIIEDAKEHFLEYLARKHNLRIYRPMYLEFDNGEEYVEFPYEHLEFEDEDNPIYNKIGTK